MGDRTRIGRDVRVVVVLGSAPLLIAQGLTESMAGRFEMTSLGHWRYQEMQQACRYSGQELSYQKMMGQLSDAGNTTTLAHYLQLLEGAGMVCGLQKYAGQAVRQRGSSPKLQVFNTALMGAIAALDGFDLERLRATPELWGRITESAVGAELLARHLEHSSQQPRIHYWREGANEVDYVLQHQGELFAFELKSGIHQGNVKGLDAFCKSNPACRPLVLGTGGLPLLSWFEGELIREYPKSTYLPNKPIR